MSEEQRPVLIPLATAHVNQTTDSQGNKSPWEVQENETNGLLATLPRNFTDKEIFRVLHFGRKFELLGFNIGMKHMQQELQGAWTKEKDNLLKVIKELDTANSKLAEKLGSFIGEEV